MSLRRIIAVTVVVLVVLAAMAFSAPTAPPELPKPSRTWGFSDPYGNLHEIYRYEDDELCGYWGGGCITTRFPGCEESGDYRLCFSSIPLAVAIPKTAPEQNSTWHAAGTTFSLLTTLERLSLLGATFEDVYVIQGRRDGLEPEWSHCVTLLFSYSQGLLGFGRSKVCEEESRIYLATELPSVGAASGAPEPAVSP